MRRTATVVVLVLAMCAAPVARADLPDAAAATDRTGVYAGSFSGLEGGSGLAVTRNDVRFVVDAYELRGSLLLRVRLGGPRTTTPRTPPPGDTLGDFFGIAGIDLDVEICSVLEIALPAGE